MSNITQVHNNNMDGKQSFTRASNSQKANDFYDFFRSANNNQLRDNLVRIASNPDLDKQDLALLVLMLTNNTQPSFRRLIRENSTCTQALHRMLETITANEGARGMKPFNADVQEIETILYGPPMSPVL